MTVLALLLLGFAATLAGSVRMQVLSRKKVVAEQLATERIEEVRNLPYDSVGVVSGNPPGTLLGTETVARSSINYTVNTTVDYVDDPLPGGYQTYAN